MARRPPRNPRSDVGWYVTVVLVILAVSYYVLFSSENAIIEGEPTAAEPGVAVPEE